MTSRDHNVAAPEFIAIVDTAHRQRGRYASAVTVEVGGSNPPNRRRVRTDLRALAGPGVDHENDPVGVAGSDMDSRGTRRLPKRLRVRAHRIEPRRERNPVATSLIRLGAQHEGARGAGRVLTAPRVGRLGHCVQRPKSSAMPTRHSSSVGKSARAWAVSRRCPSRHTKSSHRCPARMSGGKRPPRSTA